MKSMREVESPPVLLSCQFSLELFGFGGKSVILLGCDVVFQLPGKIFCSSPARTLQYGASLSIEIEQYVTHISASLCTK